MAGDVVLQGISFTDTGKGELASYVFKGRIGNCTLSINIRGDRIEVERIMSSLGATTLEDIISVDLQPNRQRKL
uniref:Uncharacterized protein n=1 Tax=viral metagenome TaxID=1070528 RepID=A0A6M3IDJ0_9ZZZZ